MVSHEDTEVVQALPPQPDPRTTPVISRASPSPLVAASSLPERREDAMRSRSAEARHGGVTALAQDTRQVHLHRPWFGRFQAERIVATHRVRGSGRLVVRIDTTPPSTIITYGTAAVVCWWEGRPGRACTQSTQAIFGTCPDLACFSDAGIDIRVISHVS